MKLQLNAVQRRVVGVLIEKAMTTPAGYPITLNALLAGCNQLTCREPVMKLAAAEVLQAVTDLKRMKLVGEPEYEPGSRVDRYRHDLGAQLKWDSRQQAVIAELLLRGPQTAGELKTNASRMVPEMDLAEVSRILSEFATQDPAVVRELPRQPGKSASRFEHLFQAVDEPRAVSTPSVDGGSLEVRVSRLEQDVAALREELRARKI